jgi:hypothetical protein
VRKAEAVASPLLAYPWMPWKNENGVWQKASDPNPDFSKMTLQDLPAPELYLQVSASSHMLLLIHFSTCCCSCHCSSTCSQVPVWPC